MWLSHYTKYVEYTFEAQIHGNNIEMSSFITEFELTSPISKDYYFILLWDKKYSVCLAILLVIAVSNLSSTFKSDASKSNRQKK